VLGEKVTSIINETLQAGEHVYKFGAKQLGYSAGIYLVKVIVNEQVYVTRIVENN
jgi:hypothetical protein